MALCNTCFKTLVAPVMHDCGPGGALVDITQGGTKGYCSVVCLEKAVRAFYDKEMAKRGPPS